MFTEIIQRCKELQNQHALILNQSEKDIVAGYMAIQYLRHPISQVEHHAMMEELLKRPLNTTEKAASYTQHAFLGDGSGLSPLYEMMNRTINEYGPFSFLMPEDKSVHFLTSDFPVWAVTTEKAIDIRSYYFALTPDIAIYVGDRKKMPPIQRNHIVRVDNTDVARFNAFVVQHAPSIVFGKNLSNAETKFILDNLP